MEKKQPQLEQHSSDTNEPYLLRESQHNKPQQEQKNINSGHKTESETQIQKQTSSFHNQQEQTKIQASLDKISIQSPLKKSAALNYHKSFERQSFVLDKISEKKEANSQKPKKQTKTGIITKNMQQSSMKSTIKNNQKVKKVNKPFYEETFYITGIKQNYLLLLSDKNQVLEFPIGMFTEQGGINFQGDQDQRDQNENTDQFHLIKDIKIGQAIKIKLEFDFFRQQKDEKLFSSLQKKIHEEYCDKDDGSVDIRYREKSPKRINSKFS